LVVFQQKKKKKKKKGENEKSKQEKYRLNSSVSVRHWTEGLQQELLLHQESIYTLLRKSTSEQNGNEKGVEYQPK
jgi:hypothetical protein